MKKFALACVLLFIPFNAYADDTIDDDAAIRHVVAEYITGWRTGDVERLRKIFALDHGHIVWRGSDEDGDAIQSMTFGEALERGKANPGYGMPYRIESLDIIDGVLAVVKFNVERAGRGSYVDYFTLYKSNGEWKIILKAFASRPGVLLDED